MTEIEVQAGVRWDQQNNINNENEEAFEEGNPAKLFERSRIKALASELDICPDAAFSLFLGVLEA